MLCGPTFLSLINEALLQQLWLLLFAVVVASVVLIRSVGSELGVRAITIAVAVILLCKRRLVGNKDNECLSNVRADVCERRSGII